MVRLTVRATDESVPPVLLKLMQERLAAGFSTAAEKHVAPTLNEIADTFSHIMVSTDAGRKTFMDASGTVR